jgi:hypothetical protein
MRYLFPARGQACHTICTNCCASNERTDVLALVLGAVGPIARYASVSVASSECSNVLALVLGVVGPDTRMRGTDSSTEETDFGG